MNKYQVLNELSENKISVTKAYKLIYDDAPQFKKAHFVKIKVRINESRGISLLLAILFFIPIPLSIIKMFARIAIKKGYKDLKDIPLSIDDIMQVISAKGIKVDVDAHDEAKIYLKTF